MPFTRPTLQQLIDRNAADIESRFPGADARLRRAVLNVIARMHAGAVHGLYGYLDFIARQTMIDTCDDDDYLARHAAQWNVPRKVPAAAKGNIVVTGTTGVSIPAGTIVQRADGFAFTTDAITTLVAGTATIPVTASLGGIAGNTAANSAVTFVSPIAGVNSGAIVGSSGFVGGTDMETVDSWRDRLLERVRKPPHAGTANDYVAWALEVSGVTRAWCYPLEGGDGKVTVRFVRDDDTPSIIPDATEVQAVSDYLSARKPIGATLTVVAPVAVALNFTIQLTPNNQTVKDAVQAELVDMLRREAQPGGTILLSHIREAVSTAAGEIDHVVTAPAANVVYATGQIPTMGAITWA